MDKFVIDQAEGLRRLLAREGSRVIAVTGGPGAPGRTTAVINLAAALTGHGKDVLVIDECLGQRSVSALLGGVRGAGNFAAVMRGEMGLDEAAGRHALGFRVLAASREHRSQYTSAQLNKVLTGPADIVLIDAELDAEGALSPLAMHAHDVLIVMRVAAQAITDAYACMKRLHFAHAIGQFRVLANHVASATDAQAAFDNLAGVASRYLTVSLENAGCVAADPHMPRAVQLSRCIVDAFPSTAAARDFRHVAAELPHWPMRPALSARSTTAADFAEAVASSDAEVKAARASAAAASAAVSANASASVSAGQTGTAGAARAPIVGTAPAGVAAAAVSALASAQAAGAQAAQTTESFVSTVTGVPSAPAPAHAGWRADPPVQRPAPQHA
ncbi:Flagellar biosynthesis protein FlhG [Paraburkholderia tropica]|nr:Flagellar biosynthesis protein FlhG [Paraburkholderia tropica]